MATVSSIFAALTPAFTDRWLRKQWADYFDSQGVKYAFYSALNAAALQEQQRAQEDILEHVQEENEAVENADKAVDGSQGEVSEDVSKLSLGDDGIAHEENDNEAEDTSETDHDEDSDDDSWNAEIPAVAGDDPELDQDPRTKVLTVQELEELFIRSAPDLSGESLHSLKPWKYLIKGSRLH